MTPAQQQQLNYSIFICVRNIKNYNWNNKKMLSISSIKLWTSRRMTFSIILFLSQRNLKATSSSPSSKIQSYIIAKCWKEWNLSLKMMKEPFSLKQHLWRSFIADKCVWILCFLQTLYKFNIITVLLTLSGRNLKRSICPP